MSKCDYDVIIIGAGIGGLVSGCYLAKAGKKVLIAEKNFKVGGYCTSFKRGGVLFDACVHTIGSCREEGIITGILKDLDMDEEINFLRLSPHRIIVSDDKEIGIDADIKSTINNLCHYYPEDKKKLEMFFETVMKGGYMELAAKLRNSTFEQFFRTYITNTELNNLFSFLLFQSAGLPSSLISAFLGVILLKEYIIDGGYYLKNGIQELPDKLRDKFISLGGEVLLNSEVEKIISDTDKSEIIIKSKDEKISANSIISNIDIMHTLKNLVPKKHGDEMSKPLKMFKQSLSCFSLYLKLNKKPPFSTNVHFVSLKKDIQNNIYDKIIKNDFENLYIDSFFNTMDNSNRAIISHIVPFNDKQFWVEHKKSFADKLLKEFSIKTGLVGEDIEVKETVTPISFYNWTYSYQGANYGWAPFVSQVFPKYKLESKIPNLYFVGHWLGMGHGISTVAYLGKMVANKIINLGN